MIKGTSKKGTEKPKAALRKTTETQTNFSKTQFSKANFHEISIDAPCKIYVDKKTSAMYITSNQTNVVSKKVQISK